MIKLLSFLTLFAALSLSACSLILESRPITTDASADADGDADGDGDGDGDADGDGDGDADSDADSDADGDADSDSDGDADADTDEAPDADETTDAQTDSCDASCFGFECGPDGCGGLCGTCTPPDICQTGICRCTPTCEARECGDDGCGGTCGSACPASEHCDEITGRCVPDALDCTFDAGWGTSCSGAWCNDDSPCVQIIGLSGYGSVCAPSCTITEHCPNIAPGAEECSIRVSGVPRYCAVRCDRNTDCTCGLQCRRVGDDAVCYP